MFLDSGDGVVFLGEFGPWYSPDTKQFHLSKDAARNLLAGALKTYQAPQREATPHRGVPSRTFHHLVRRICRLLRKPCPSNIKLVGIRVRQDRDSLRLFRDGGMPVLRGTFLQLE